MAQEIHITETVLGEESGYTEGHRLVFDQPRIVDYRARVLDIAEYLLQMMQDADLRNRLGVVGRTRVVECFDYRVVARRFVDIVTKALQVS